MLSSSTFNSFICVSSVKAIVSNIHSASVRKMHTYHRKWKHQIIVYSFFFSLRSFNCVSSFFLHCEHVSGIVPNDEPTRTQSHSLAQSSNSYFIQKQQPKMKVIEFFFCAHCLSSCIRLSAVSFQYGICSKSCVLISNIRDDCTICSERFDALPKFCFWNRHHSQFHIQLKKIYERT